MNILCHLLVHGYPCPTAVECQYDTGISLCIHQAVMFNQLIIMDCHHKFARQGLSGCCRMPDYLCVLKGGGDAFIDESLSVCVYSKNSLL